MAIQLYDDGSALVDAAEWRAIQRDIRKLLALEAAGVDNWEWYDEAMSSMEDEE